MYFMPQATTMMYRTFAPLKPTYRYIITLSLLMSLLYVWYYGLYCMLARKIMTSKDTIEQIHKQYTSVQERETLKAATETVDCLLTNYNKTWKRKGLELLLDYATKAGLHSVSCDVTTKNPEPWYTQDTVSMSCNGSFKEFLYFFSLFSESNIIFSCENITMMHHDGKKYTCSCLFTILTVQ